MRGREGTTVRGLACGRQDGVPFLVPLSGPGSWNRWEECGREGVGTRLPGSQCRCGLGQTLPLLCLSFSVCEMGITHGVGEKICQVSMCGVLGLGPGPQEVLAYTVVIVAAAQGGGGLLVGFQGHLPQPDDLGGS